MSDAKTNQEQNRPQYEKPELNVMTQEELLAAFQVSQAGITWWTM